LVALVAAALLPALAVGAAAVWNAVDGHRAAYEARLHDTARAFALAVAAEIDTFRSAMAALAGSAELDLPEPDSVAFEREARRAAAALKTTVALVDPISLRQVVNTSLPDGEVPRSPAREVFRTVAETSRPMVTDLAVGHMAGRPVASVAVPVERNGRILYVLVARLDPARLSGLLATQASGLSFATLIDGNNIVVARSREHERFVGQPLLPWIVEGTAGREAGLLRGKNRLGEESISAFRRLSGAAPGWMVILGDPISAYNTAMWAPVRALAYGGLVAIVLALAVAYLIGWRVLRPVRALTQQAEAVAASGGEAPVRDIPPGRVAEFERLHNAVRAADAALRSKVAEVSASDARLRVAVEAARFSTWEYDVRHGLGSRRGALADAIPALPPRGFGFADWMALIHPDDRPRVEAAYTAVMRGRADRAQEEFRVRKADGAWTWVESAGAAVEWNPQTGEVLRMAGIAHDVTQRREAAERQRLLAREIDHRAKNALAVVQSMLRLTPKDEPRAFAAAVEARIAALARAHTLLAESGWAGADLRAVVERELAPFASVPGGVGPRVSLNGPVVVLDPAAVQPVAMVLHELATNAVKHGALSVPGGSVEICWRIHRRAEKDGLICLQWREAGGPPIQVIPERRGFGTRVVEATVRGQLGGSAERRWEPSGLVVEVMLPLARVLAGLDEKEEHGISTPAPDSP
jgi:two-component sensor histidine kinase